MSDSRSIVVPVYPDTPNSIRASWNHSTKPKQACRSCRLHVTRSAPESAERRVDDALQYGSLGFRLRCTESP